MVHKSSVALWWRLNESRYNLVGTKCSSCGNIFYPPRELCSECRRKGKIEKFRLSGKGKIVSYTVIHNAPEGFEKITPYVVALIKTEEGPIVSGMIDDIDIDGLCIGNVAGDNGKVIDKTNKVCMDLIGCSVRTVFRKMYDDEAGGLIHYGIKWVLVE